MKDTADSGGRSRDGAARDEQNTPELPPVKHTKLTDSLSIHLSNTVQGLLILPLNKNFILFFHV